MINRKLAEETTTLAAKPVTAAEEGKRCLPMIGECVISHRMSPLPKGVELNGDHQKCPFAPASPLR